MESSSPTVARRNFVLNFLEGALYAASGALISPQTVLPAHVSKLGGDNIAVGAVSVIAWVGLFLPQIFASRIVESHPWKKPWAIRFGLAQRAVLLVYAVGLFALAPIDPNAALWLFFILFTTNQLLLGVTTPGWFEMFAKMVPVNRRGRLVGIRSSLGGLGALACGALLTWYLSRFDFPASYSLAFFTAFVLQLGSILLQLRLVEEYPSPARQRRPLFAYLRELPNVLRTNVPFRNFLVATIFQIIATMPVGFYTVYALTRFQADETMVGKFTLAIVAIQVVSSLGIGMLADKRGNKVALVIAASALFCANLLAVFSASLDWFLLVYIFLGINIGSEILARYNISIEYGPPEQRATYVGLMNTIIAPFYFVGMLGGVISNIYGYTEVFILGTCASVIGVILTVFIVQDPRRVNT